VPTLWLVTGAAIVVAAAVIAFLVSQNRPAAALVEPSFTTPPALAHDRELGSATAPLTLDVWSDYQCPFCEQFWTASEPRLVSTFVTTGQVRLVYHDFTFIGQESLDAAVAARCADRQGRFWPYHDVLFANQGKENSGAFSADRLATMAAMSGLDVEGWRSCLADESVSQAIAQETNQGRAAGVTGTPALFVNGAKVAGYDFPTVSAAIEAALRGAQAAGPSGPPDSSGAPPPATSAAP
jgi:protein-disulfide isomerase